jgi:protein gp37
MGDNSNIEWTDATWNPVVGCSIVSPGCTNCYAMKFAGNRLDGNPKAPHYAGTTQKSKAGPVWSGRLALAPQHILTAPLRWKKPRQIFVNSMGDLFHEDCPDEWIDKVFAVMALAPQHTFQCLTKRSSRMREYLSDPRRRDFVSREIRRVGDRPGRPDMASGEARRKPGSELRGTPMPESQGGVPSTGRISSGDNHDKRQEDDGFSPQGGVDLFQWTDTSRHNDQPQGRGESEQQPRKLGACNALGTEASRSVCIGGEETSSQRKQTPQDIPSGEGCLGDEVDAQIRLAGEGYSGEVRHGCKSGVSDHNREDLETHIDWPLPNVWLGVSVEDQKRADERIPHLLETPAAVRFISAEPLLGPIDLFTINRTPPLGSMSAIPCDGENFTSLDWVIAGGESGPGARLMHPDWARGLRDQCAAAGLPFFMKQMTKKGPIPDDLMIRKWPNAA